MKAKKGDKMKLKTLGGDHLIDTTYEADPLSELYTCTSILGDGFLVNNLYYYEDNDIQALYTLEDHPEYFL